MRDLDGNIVATRKPYDATSQQRLNPSISSEELKFKKMKQN